MSRLTDCRLFSMHGYHSHIPLRVAVDVESGQPLFKCQTCPYIYSVDKEVRLQKLISGTLCVTSCNVMSNVHHHMPGQQSQPDEGSLVQISREAQLKKKEVDDVLGGSDAWKNVQTTTGNFLASYRDCAMLT